MTRRFQATSLGEAQLRLTLSPGSSFTTVRHLRVCAAGTEANVMALLARLGHHTAFVSVMARTALGRRAIEEIAVSGTDISGITWTESGRVGLYFLDPGADPLPGHVIYDRDNTPFAGAEESMINWSALLDTEAIFLSGITAGLSPASNRLVRRAATDAHKQGTAVIYDVNHRHRLWSAETGAAFLTDLAASIRLLFCPIRDAESLLGIKGTAHEVAQELRARLDIAEVVVSDGSTGAAYAGRDTVMFQEALSVRVLDRPGAGDALAGGFLHGWFAGDPSVGLRLGVRASALALTRYGDQLACGIEDIGNLAIGQIDR